MSTTPVTKALALKNIMFATDFSELSENILPVALGLARYYDATVTFFHLLTPSLPSSMPPGCHGLAMLEPPLVDVNQPRREAEEAMARLLRQQDLHGLNWQVIIREGRLGAILAEIVRERKMDLVVVASEGRRGIKKLLFGSAAEEIIRSVSCPVFTVGPVAGEHVCAGLSINRVICPIDFSPGSAEALRWGGLLANDTNANLTILHVASSVPPRLPREDAILRMRQAVDEAFRNRTLDRTPQFELVYGSSAHEICNFVHPGDVVVIGARGIRLFTETSTHLLGGTAHGVICSCAVPVFIVHSTKS